jgi:hypothetical protein
MMLGTVVSPVMKEEVRPIHVEIVGPALRRIGTSEVRLYL